MTVSKSQGSRVTAHTALILPDTLNPVLTEGAGLHRRHPRPALVQPDREPPGRVRRGGQAPGAERRSGLVEALGDGPGASLLSNKEEIRPLAGIGRGRFAEPWRVARNAAGALSGRGGRTGALGRQ